MYTLKYILQVDENREAACNNIRENSLGEKIMSGPPSLGCQEDGERFCLCGKRGLQEKRVWRFMCGRCRKNEPFSFKIDLGRAKGKRKEKGKKNAGKRKNKVNTKKLYFK